jgi:XTP/dITP diphosphohydrolase
MAVTRRVVLASLNKGKVREVAQLLAGSGLKVVSQSEFDIPEAEETAPTFVENALLKARNAARHTGLPAIADDSGLAVDALDGAPGIYSARYAGPEADDAANNRKLLEALAGLPASERGARFICCVVYLRHADDPVPLICEGVWRGQLLESPRGDNGFGYDPLFLVPELGLTSAQLPPEEKNRLSHRGQALRQLVGHLTGCVD